VAALQLFPQETEKVVECKLQRLLKDANDRGKSAEKLPRKNSDQKRSGKPLIHFGNSDSDASDDVNLAKGTEMRVKRHHQPLTKQRKLLITSDSDS
jgi:hypothetical protein